MNIGGIYRSTLLEDIPIDQTRLKVIIIGNQAVLNQAERESIEKFAGNKLILEMQKEKKVILYNTKRFYEILTNRSMNAKVL